MSCDACALVSSLGTSAPVSWASVLRYDNWDWVAGSSPVTQVSGSFATESPEGFVVMRAAYPSGSVVHAHAHAPLGHNTRLGGDVPQASPPNHSRRTIDAHEESSHA